MTRKILISAAFRRANKRLRKRGAEVAASIDDAIELLALNAFDPRLKTHELKGNLAEVYACSGAYDLRIVFEFVDGGAQILLLAVGTHDEVY